MPYCKNCHQPISRSDYDICPHCGAKNPISGTYETMDVTSNITGIENHELYRTRSQKTAGLLAMFLGVFGIHEFYIRKPKKGLAILITTLVFVASAGCMLFFTVLNNLVAFVIPLAFGWIIYFIYGFIFLKKDSPKDGNGEFLR